MSRTQRRTRTILDGAYELVENLGRGSRSTVYRARALRALDGITSEEFVAVKILRDTDAHPLQNIERIRREGMALFSVQSEFVLRAYDYVANQQLCYLVLEVIRGGSLQSTLDTHPDGVSPRLAISFLRQLLLGLSEIHRAGIVHRDIKLENILVTQNGGIKISDFGVALLPTDDLTDPNLQRDIGTLEYLSPEVLEFGLLSPAMDLYAAALCGYALFSGRLPFEGDSINDQLNRKLCGERAPLELNEEFSSVESLFVRALAPDPRDRFLNANEFLSALNQVEMGEPIPPPSKRMSSLSGRFESITLAPFQTGSGSRSLASDSSLQPEVAETASFAARTLGVVRRMVSEFRRSPNERALALSAIFLLSCTLLGANAFLSKEAAEARLPEPKSGSEENLTHTFFQGLKELIWDSETPAYDLLQRLSTGTHTGRMTGLLDEGEVLTIFTEGVPDEGKFLFSIGLPGWSPQSIVLFEGSKSREIFIAGSGMQLSFWLDRELAESDVTLRGIYRDHATGREGRWELTR